MIYLIAGLTAFFLVLATLTVTLFRNRARFAPLLFLLAFISASIGGLFLWEASEVPSPLIGRPLPEFSLTPVGGGTPVTHEYFADGKVRVINVWASWCTPCRVEHGMLMEMKDQGIEIIGLNYKDDPEKSAAFLAELGNPFVANLEDPRGRTAIDLGVYGVPESFVVDGEGRIAHKHIGPILEMQLPDLLAKIAEVQQAKAQ